MRNLDARIETFALRRHFTISRGTKTETIVVVASVNDGDVTGRGECGPNARYDETPESVVSDILSMAPAIRAGMTAGELQDAMPPSARLASKRSTPAWDAGEV